MTIIFFFVLLASPAASIALARPAVSIANPAASIHHPHVSPLVDGVLEPHSEVVLQSGDAESNHSEVVLQSGDAGSKGGNLSFFYWPPMYCYNNPDQTAWTDFEDVVATSWFGKQHVLRDMQKKMCPDRYSARKKRNDASFKYDVGTFDFGPDVRVLSGAGGFSGEWAWGKRKPIGKNVTTNFGVFKTKCYGLTMGVELSVGMSFSHIQNWRDVTGLSVAYSTSVDVGVGVGSGAIYCCRSKKAQKEWKDMKSKSCVICGKTLSASFGIGVSLVTKLFCNTTKLWSTTCTMPKTECKKKWTVF